MWENCGHEHTVGEDMTSFKYTGNQFQAMSIGI